MAQHNVYFSTTGRSKWSMEDFFKHSDNARYLGEQDTRQLTKIWVQALNVVAKDARGNCHDRNTATRLIRIFKSQGPSLESRTFPPTSSTPSSSTPSSSTTSSSPTSSSAPPLSAPSIVLNNNIITRSFNGDRLSFEPVSPQIPRKRSCPSTPQQHSKKRKDLPSGYHVDFKRMWKAMDNSKKWRLSDDVYVEDILYKRFKDHPTECAAHSWVIDTSDKLVESCFQPAHWEIISAEIPVLQEPDDSFLSSMVAHQDFDNQDQLLKHFKHNAVFKSEEEYDQITSDEHDWRIWLRDVMRLWCELLSGSIFNMDHQESWYICKFWGPLFDRCMETIPGGYVARGESKSLGTCERKHSYDPHHKNRRLVGHLYDGILRLDNHEFGATEHAKKFKSTSDSKWVQDSLKVAKVLHDMLHRLQSSQGSCMLQVVGMVAAGWHCQMWRMSYAKGYMCLSVGGTIHKVPQKFKGVDGIEAYFGLLSALWGFRCMLKSQKEMMDSQTSAPDRLRERLKDAFTSMSRFPEGPIIPRSARTDEGSSDSYDLSD